MHNLEPSVGVLEWISKVAGVGKLVAHPLEIITNKIQPSLVLIQKSPVRRGPMIQEGTHIAQSLDP